MTDTELMDDYLRAHQSLVETVTTLTMQEFWQLKDTRDNAWDALSPEQQQFLYRPHY